MCILLIRRYYLGSQQNENFFTIISDYFNNYYDDIKIDSLNINSNIDYFLNIKTFWNYIIKNQEFETHYLTFYSNFYKNFYGSFYDLILYFKINSIKWLTIK